MCDNPECAGHRFTPEELREQLMDRIMEFGHQVNYIFGDVGTPAFSYSVGRSVFERPELLVVGDLPSSVEQYIINRVARLEIEGAISVAALAESGEDLDEILEGYPVRIVGPIDPDAAKMYYATSLSENITAYQILWPDKDGRWPGDPAFSYGPEAQPVYA